MQVRGGVAALAVVLTAAATACVDISRQDPDGTVDVAVDVPGPDAQGEVEVGEPDADEDVAPDVGPPDTVEDTADDADAGCTPVDCEEQLGGIPACRRALQDPETCLCTLETMAARTPCDDGSACSIEDRCTSNGNCLGQGVDDEALCDDGNPCTQDACDVETGCFHAPVAGACDDGDPCTKGEVCLDGVCQEPTQYVCGTCDPEGEDTCEDDHGDGDACNGALVCVDGFCQVDEETVVTCEGTGDPCTATSCDPASGECVDSALPDGSLCTDGSVCTVEDRCLEGLCVGTPSGVEACGCAEDDDCLAVDDGDLCNGVPACVDGVCMFDPETVVVCDGSQDTACLRFQCDPATGECGFDTAEEGSPCDDGLACTLDDACSASGFCEGGAQVDCSHLDGPCAEGTCDEQVGCVSAPLGGSEGQPCDPGDPCVAEAACSGGDCVAQAVTDCDDGDSCTVDSCVQGEGCEHAGPPAPACPDQGVCAGGVPLACQDGGYVCDLAAVEGWSPVDFCGDGLDDDCDGTTDGDGCVTGSGCGVGAVSQDYDGAMQACAAEGGVGWQDGLCGAGWHVCTYDQMTAAAGEQTIPAGFWIAATVSWDPESETFSVRDAADGACAEFAGTCGQARTLQAMTWDGLYQDQLPYAAEAWGCVSGEPEADCETVALDGVMCCADACAGDADCDDQDPCTADTCDALLGACTHEAPEAPGCATKGVCKQGVPITCDENGVPACGYASLPGWEAAEASCDGLDNDCDGLTDVTDPDLAVGEPPLCEDQDGVCAGARHTLSHCQDGAWQPCGAGAYQAASEAWEDGAETLCDGLDNNCDGKTDEAFAWKGKPVGAPCEGIGICAEGQVICAEGGAGATCSTMPGGTAPEDLPETCNGLDDDCDGQTDEASELVPTADDCTQDGVCADASPACVDGVWQCHEDMVQGYEVDEATCDALDNDCDGETDEGLTWTGPGGEEIPKGEPCGTEACQGEVVCAPDGGGLVCSASLDGDTELCDGIDNNCDGQTDEGLTWAAPTGEPVPLGETCTGWGVCAAESGVVECGAGKKTVCSTAPGGSGSLATEEVCNDQDDDCDGGVDEDLTWQGLPLGADCDGIGACGAGLVECAGSGATTCSTNPDGSSSEAAPESCNGLDDDCDGQTDEAEDLAVAESGCSFSGVCTVQNVSATCEGGAWSCDYAGAVAAGYQEGDETGLCDGRDNDCDGQTDEDFPALGEACDGADGDQCERGTVVCDEGGAGTTCEGDAEVVEACNGVDDDCDGLTDEPDAEGCTSWWTDVDGDAWGTGDPQCLCGPDGTAVAERDGDCADGDVTVHPHAGERCNGVDDDCDGATDAADAADLLATDSTLCGDQDGVCAGVTRPASLCQGGAWQPCTDATFAGARPDTYEPDGEQSCDGRDNDCDGATDADDPDLEGVTRPCQVQAGVCSGSMVPASYCQDGAWKACDYAVYSAHSADWEEDEEATCDGLDNDCDGTADEPFTVGGKGIGQTCDGAGACGSGVVECRADGTGATCSTNPDGSSPETEPEACNGKDDDCDGVTDDGLGVADSPCFVTGVCSPQNVSAACTNGGWTCSYAAVPYYEDGEEASCDGRDNDCDGATDEDFTWPAPTGQTLVKGDPCGSGECNGVVICSGDGSGLVCSSEGDVPEVCDDADNDCDGSTDEDLTWTDATGAALPKGTDCDGTGACGPGVVECGSQLEATCSTNPDGSASEAQPEVCNGVDDDCDGETDEGFTWQGQALDAGCDGTGACGVGFVQCAPDGLSATCSTNPDGTERQDVPETCNGLDDDCDGQADDGLGYADSDCKKQGVCTPQTVSATCMGAAGWDCAYTSSLYSGDTEAGGAWCDSRDNDCDGQADEDWPDKGTACDGTDPDQCALGTWRCTADHAGLECAETEHRVELCDPTGADEDCDGDVNEEGASDCTVYGLDVDGDAFGDDQAGTRCFCPGWQADHWTATRGGDCNDSDGGVNPDAQERCDATDWNCDKEPYAEDALGCAVYAADLDGDGWGDPDDVRCLCDTSGVYTAKEHIGDCNDGEADIHPGAQETCKEVDMDCDGHVYAEGAEGCDTYYFDGDGDGWGDPTSSRCLCEPDPETGHTATERDANGDGVADWDCCDTVSSAYPGQTAYFPDELPSGCDGGWNYNCDYDAAGAPIEERRWTSFGGCRKTGSVCEADVGWVGGLIVIVPSCGQSGQLIRNAKFHCVLKSFACERNPTTAVQECR